MAPFRGSRLKQREFRPWATNLDALLIMLYQIHPFTVFFSGLEVVTLAVQSPATSMVSQVAGLQC